MFSFTETFSSCVIIILSILLYLKIEILCNPTSVFVSISTIRKLGVYEEHTGQTGRWLSRGETVRYVHMNTSSHKHGPKTKDQQAQKQNQQNHLPQPVKRVKGNIVSGVFSNSAIDDINCLIWLPSLDTKLEKLPRKAASCVAELLELDLVVPH